MKEAMDINILSLALGFILLLIPIFGFIYFRIRIIKDMLIAVLRMVLQLSFIAIYLQYIFNLNNAWLNTAWVVAMVIIGAFTSIRRIGLHYRYFLLPLFFSGLTSILILDGFFLGFVIRLEYVFDARYFIPISGMILGNALNHNIIGLSHYFDSLQKDSELYYFLLINGSSRRKAIEPFIGAAIKKALNPMIATMSVIGLISLPGMMTGQILGGSSPVVAIKYQIVIMLAIFVGSNINLLLGIILSNRRIFDSFDNLQTRILKQTKEL